jgi:hypothetical protein
MGRGNNFNHKRKGHEQKTPKYGVDVAPKDNEYVEFSIETTAKDGRKPVEIVKNK